MQKKILFTISFFTISTLFNSLFAQGALDGYFKGKKKFDLALSGGFQSATTYTGGNGTFDLSRTLGMASIFGAYGLNDRLDLVVSLPYIGDNLQDISAYAKIKMIDNRISGRPFTMAAGFGFSNPVSNYNAESASSIGQRATQFHGHLIFQSTLFSNFSMQLQGAYHYALDPVPSSLTASGKLIYTHEKWYLDAWYEFQDGFGDVSYGVISPSPSFREFFVDYHRVGGVVYKGLGDSWGIFINGSHILSGKNTFNTTTVMGGFVKKFDFNQKSIKKPRETKTKI